MNLTDDALRVKVAELCGWEPCQEVDYHGWFYHAANDCRQTPFHSLPDYCNDLNAMHAAEKALNDDEHDRFRDHLGSILRNGEYYHWSDGGGMRGFVSATARQRAEAFVKTLTP